MDAGMSCVAAIHEMLLHEIRGVHHVFRGAPARWRDASFGTVRAAGGVLVGAKRRNGATVEVTLRATVDATFVLASPWPGRRTRISDGRRRTQSAEGLLRLSLRKGQTLVLAPVR